MDATVKERAAEVAKALKTILEDAKMHVDAGSQELALKTLQTIATAFTGGDLVLKYANTHADQPLDKIAARVRSFMRAAKLASK